MICRPSDHTSGPKERTRVYAKRSSNKNVNTAFPRRVCILSANQSDGRKLYERGEAEINKHEKRVCRGRIIEREYNK